MLATHMAQRWYPRRFSSAILYEVLLTVPSTALSHYRSHDPKKYDPKKGPGQRDPSTAAT